MKTRRQLLVAMVLWASQLFLTHTTARHGDTILLFASDCMIITFRVRIFIIGFFFWLSSQDSEVYRINPLSTMFGIEVAAN